MHLILQPILILAKCLLLSPICTHRYPKTRKISLILSLLVAISYIIAYLQLIFAQFFLWKSSFVNSITHFNLCIACACTTTLLTTACIHHDRFEQIMEKLADIDAEINWKSYKNTNRHMFIYFVVWSINTIYMLFEVIANVFFESISNELPASFYCAYNMAIIMAGGFTVIYVTLLQVVQERFEYIAKNLKQLPETNDVFIIERNLRRLGALHLRVCDVINIINDCFSVSVFAVIAMFFIHLLTNLYMVGVIQNCVQHTDFATGLLVISLCHCCPDMLVFGILCYRGRMATKYVCTSIMIYFIILEVTINL